MQTQDLLKSIGDNIDTVIKQAFGHAIQSPQTTRLISKSY